MDLWTIIKTVVRRWYVTLPLIVITAAVGYQVTSSAPPAYGSNATVLLVVPTQVAAGTGGQAVTGEVKQNPYLAFSGSLAITANALAHVVTDDAHRRVFADQGLVSDYKLTPATELPGVIVDATGPKPAAVTETVQRAMQEMKDLLAALQDDAGVPANQRITMKVLDAPTAAVKLQPKIARLAAGIGAVGLAVTIGMGLLAESLANARRTDRLDRPVGQAELRGGPPKIAFAGPRRLSVPPASVPMIGDGGAAPADRPPKLVPADDPAATEVLDGHHTSTRWRGERRNQRTSEGDAPSDAVPAVAPSPQTRS